MKNEKNDCVFGPIPSRRLGVSLGVDLLPFKTCSMDCIYCECGKTTNLTTERKEYFPTEKAIARIDEVLSAHPHVDYVTFSGVGEPTLHSGIGKIIRHVKQTHPEVRLCLLTNSVALTLPGVIDEVAPCDLVIPSLDGSTQEELERMNRPAAGVRLDAIADALVELKKKMKGRLWLEIFIAKGVNDSKESAERFRELVRRIRPDKVQLNTLDRPGTEKNVEIPDPAVLDMLCSVIGASAKVERIGGRAAKVKAEAAGGIESYNSHIIETCRSRPCTPDDIARSLGFDLGMAEAHLRRMEKAGLVVSENGPRGLYYRPADTGNSPSV